MTDNYYSGLVASLAARLISIATSFVVIWAFSLIGRDMYGVYAFAGSWVAIFIVFGCYGLDQLILYRQSRNRSDPQLTLLKASLGIGRKLSLALGILYLLLGAVQTKYLEPSTDYLVYVAFAITIPAVVSTHIFSAWHQAFQDFNRALLVPRTTEMLRLLFIIPLGLLLPDVDLYLLVIVISAWVPLALYRMDIGALPASKFEIDQAGKEFAKQMVMVRLVRSSVDNIGIIMVGLLTSPGLTAAFALGTRLASFALLGNQLLGQVTLPRIGLKLGQSDLEGMMNEFDRHRWTSLLVALGVTITLMVFGHRVVGLFGSYADALPVLYGLLSANIFASGFGPVGNALKMGGHASKLLRSVLVLLLLLFGTNLALVPVFGIVGAAFGAMASIFVVNLLNWWQCYRAYRIWTSGPLAFFVMFASNIGIFLFVSGMSEGGFFLLGVAIIITITKGLQSRQTMINAIKS